MAGPRGKRRLMGEINVVPYIDVMLVLLIIFMVTAPLLTQGIEVDLPKADAEPLDVEQENEPLAYAHHGSLARDIRTEVEKRLKHGELKAIVATASLELGIDIGDLDASVLVGYPGTIASLWQQAGRAGRGARIRDCPPAVARS